MTSDDRDESTHELVMPFLPVRSKGGPHDDDAYVAGYEMGKLDAELAARHGVDRAIHSENEEQADLIAMRHGYYAEYGDEVDGWMWMELFRTKDAL